MNYLISRRTSSDVSSIALSVVPISSYRDRLNMRQRLFCEHYIFNTDTFGNGVQSYIRAYNKDKDYILKHYGSIRSTASENLMKPDICGYINELLFHYQLNDTAVDRQLAFLIAQSGDMSVKIQAIKEYNKLKQRIIDKTEVNNVVASQFNINITVMGKDDTDKRIDDMMKSGNVDNIVNEGVTSVDDNVNTELYDDDEG